MNMAYTLGFFAGIVSVAIITGLISIIYKKKYGKKKNEYDERQEALRGKAYKTAYFALMCYLIVNGLITKGLEIRWAETLTESLLGIFLSVMVFVIICIKNDAYISLSEKPATYMSLFSVIGFVNIVIGILYYIRHNTFMTDGILNEYAINLFSGVMFLILASAIAVKMFHERQSRKRDDDI